MGYLFLALALLAGSTKGYCGKKTSGFVREYKDAMFTNFVRMVLCILISFLLLALSGRLLAFGGCPERRTDHAFVRRDDVGLRCGVAARRPPRSIYDARRVFDARRYRAAFIIGVPV